jgi:hypothetical protein
MPSSLSAWFGYDELRYESGGMVGCGQLCCGMSERE